MAKSRSSAISFRVRRDQLDRLERLAKATDRPRSWHIDQALDAYLDYQAWQIEHIERGVAALDAGRVVSHASVRKWLRSWGKARELGPPK